MMRLRTMTCAAVSTFIAIVAAAGCGSSGGSDFENGGPGNGGPIGNPGPGNGGGGVGGGPAPVGNDLKECASTTAKGELAKVNLITMFDKSGSMGRWQDQAGNWHDNTAARWTPVSTGMGDFFADGASAGLKASLSYFPQLEMKWDNQGRPYLGSSCTVSKYEARAVDMTTLASGTFRENLAKDENKPQGGTPTRVALRGAVNYAESIAKGTGETAVVLLVTDGEPNDCNSNEDNVAAVAADGLGKGIRTYVIGVGPETAAGGAIDKIAKSGGTTGIHVEVGNAEKTKQDLLTQLNKIRGDVMSCDFALPPPPDGKTLDPTTVNVVFTPAGGAPQTLPYNADCAGGQGWKYDNPSAPTKVGLCESQCGAVRANQGGQITVAYGCKQVVIIK